MQHIYQNSLKEGNGDNKYLWCPDIIYKNFEVLHLGIILDKVEFECAGTFKA